MMWTLTVRSPVSEPREYILKPGVQRIGRDENTDIVVSDNLVSRAHAEIQMDAAGRHVTLVDLGSTNGTYVNHQRLTPSKPHMLRPDDAIRIGSNELRVSQRSDETQVSPITGSHAVSQAMVLESFDRHAVLLYEIINRLNKVFDVEGALKEIALLMQRSLGVEKCEIFLPHQFKELTGCDFPTTYAERAIHQREAVFIPNLTLSITPDISESAGRLQIRSLLCVPAILNEQVIALIYLYNTSSKGRLLDKSDLHVAVAVAHLAALTMERVFLAEKLKDQEKVHQLLKRLLPPTDANALLDGYLKTGRLPELSEQTATVLFADIADSTHLAEKLGPQRFGDILRRYYQDMTNIVFEHGGLIDKYLGDGIMAVFGMSSDQTNVEIRAVEAGLQMLGKLEKDFHGEGNPITIGVGVNTGPVIAGYVVTHERVELSILGDTVNVASRLEGLARPNRLLIGPQTCEAVKEHFDLHSLGPVEIRGRTETVQVHEVVRM
ncbi:MAG: adenylate/guanylate cyclase domain-containing protein [Anaerolineales bacterium]|nr:adenylate/guanylate cyclase domain-containing protein [Anaerolineales bacterium]